MNSNGIAILLTVGALLASPALRAQAPADACEESRKLHAPYVTEARDSYVLVQYKQSEAIHRQYHEIFTAAAASKTVIKDEVLGSVGPWLQLEMPADLAALSVEQRLELQAKMQRELQRRIDLLDSIGDAELKARLDRLNAEIDRLEAQMASGDCSAPPAAAD